MHRAGACCLLFDEHGVAVAEEAVAFLDGDFVDAEDVFAVVERGDQHQERRFRQVEVRDERFDDLELVAWVDEDACGAVACLHEVFAALLIEVRCALYCSGGSRSDGNDSAARFDGLVYRVCCFLIHEIFLEVHVMLFDILNLDRSERSNSYV